MDIKKSLKITGRMIIDLVTMHPESFLTKKYDTGKPIYNLEVKVSLAKKTFDDTLSPAIEEIKMYGKAISVAQKLFTGFNYVTDQGYLLKGHNQNVETMKANLYIDENISGLIILDKMLKGKLKDNPMRPRVHFHQKPRGVYRIGVDGRYMYLQEIRGINKIEQKLEKIVKNTPH